MQNLNERFAVIPEIVSQSGTQTSTTNSDADVVGSSVQVDNKPAAGTCYRITIAGVLSGGNAAHTIDLHLGGTTLITLTNDDVTAGDWIAEFMVMILDSNNQRIMGTMQTNALDCESDYAAATVNLSSGGELKAVICSGNGSDTVTTEMVVVEKWVMELTES